MKPSKEELENLYKSASVTKLAEYYHVGKRKILNWFDEYKIQTRSFSEQCKIDSKKKKKICPISKDELYILYYEKNKSPNEIGQIYNVSRTCVTGWLKTFDIVLRRHEESSKIVADKQKGVYRRGEEPRIFLDNEEWLKFQRIEEKKSIEDIADELNINSFTVGEYCKKYNLDGRLAKVSNINKFTDEQYISMYNSGMSVNEISKKYGINNLHLKFKEIGIEFRPPNSYDHPFIHISKAHQDIIDYIKEIYKGEILINNRSIIGIELDILIPEKKFGIEFNGLFYHNEEAGKDRLYHYNKTNKCEEKGIFLFHIFEDQWKEKKEVVLSMICNRLDLTPNKIYARKCKLKEVNIEERIKFFNENHIQGGDSATLAYGLYYNDELISCMSFGKPFKNKEYKWELKRFACKKYTNVCGGFSKLLNNFKNNNIGDLISYADVTYSSKIKNVYNTNGFKLIRRGTPDYSYLDKKMNKRLRKEKFRKNILIKDYPQMSLLSESEIMKSLGYKRIWNCGIDTWLLKNPQ